VSRFEGKIASDGDVPVEAAEILAQLTGDRSSGARKRQDAVARYLSASEGWREVLGELGGAFAPLESKETGLKG
jgi:hypothetical protein